MTEKELATYESVNAMIMLIGYFLHTVDNYLEHIYYKKTRIKPDW